MTLTQVESPSTMLAMPDPADRSSALEGQDMLCFSHDWTGDPLSKTHLMRLLARKNRILWVNSIGYRTPSASTRDINRALRKLSAAVSPVTEAERNIFVLNPLIFPAHGSRTIRAFNRSFLRFQICRAMRKLGMKHPINWVFNPAAAIIAGHLGEQRLIYYCVDEYTAFTGVPRQSLVEMEQQLLRKADLVIVSAEKLLESKRAFNSHIHLVRHGVDFEHFRKALDPSTNIPEELCRLPRPIIGYFGLIAEDWVDLDLLTQVAKKFPHASVVMLGKVTMDVGRLQACPNVHFLGRKPYGSLPAYCKGFDVALIPFPINEATLHSNPLKAREYLAAGLPVVSTRIPEVAVLSQCAVAADAEQFIALVQDALGSPGPSARRSESIRHESWNARLAEIATHFEALTAPRGPCGARNLSVEDAAVNN